MFRNYKKKVAVKTESVFEKLILCTQTKYIVIIWQACFSPLRALGNIPVVNEVLIMSLRGLEDSDL